MVSALKPITVMSQTWITTEHSVTWWLFQCQATDLSQGRVCLGLLLLLSFCSAFLSVLIKEWDWKKSEFYTFFQNPSGIPSEGFLGHYWVAIAPFFFPNLIILSTDFSTLIPLLLFSDCPGECNGCLWGQVLEEELCKLGFFSWKVSHRVSA